MADSILRADARKRTRLIFLEDRIEPRDKRRLGLPTFAPEGTIFSLYLSVSLGIE
jgi:hypothetical protein